MNSKDPELLCDSDKIPLFRSQTQRPCTLHGGKWWNGSVLPLVFTSALAVSVQLHARAAQPLGKQLPLHNEQEAGSLLIECIRICVLINVLIIGSDLKSQIHGMWACINYSMPLH